jgi:hypothetical protein
MAEHAFLCRNCFAKIQTTPADIGVRGTRSNCGFSFQVPDDAAEAAYRKFLLDNGINPYAPGATAEFLVEPRRESAPAPGRVTGPGAFAARALTILGGLFLVLGCFILVVGLFRLKILAGNVIPLLTLFWMGFASFVLSAILRASHRILARLDSAELPRP